MHLHHVSHGNNTIAVITCRVTFRPAINRGRADGGVDTNGEYNNNCTSSVQEGSVFDRLLQYASKLTEKKQMQEHLVHRPVDPATGRRFFKPLTGRKPQTDVS
jgi:hypothetical protein